MPDSFMSLFAAGNQVVYFGDSDIIVHVIIMIIYGIVFSLILQQVE